MDTDTTGAQASGHDKGEEMAYIAMAAIFSPFWIGAIVYFACRNSDAFGSGPAGSFENEVR